MAKSNGKAAEGSGLMTQSAYAVHRGVSRQLISRWARAGRLAMAGGLVHVAKSDAILAADLDPTKGGRNGKPERRRDAPAADAQAAAPAAEEQPQGHPVILDGYNKARALREGWAARQAEVAYRQTVGDLVEREAYRRGLLANLGPTIQRFRAMPARLSTRLAAETDVRKVESMLDQEIAALCEDVARYASTLVGDQVAA